MDIRNKSQKPTSWFWLLVIFVTAGVFAWYTILITRGVILEYDQIDEQNAKTIKAQTQKVELGSDFLTVNIPTLNIFASNSDWMYVSAQSPLTNNYEATDLEAVGLPHGKMDDVRLKRSIIDNLTALFAKAEQDGNPLMISSAYRSVSDQRDLYDEFVKTKGEAMAKQYVAIPGSSEHHTGYSVDVTDASSECTQDSNDCNLSSSTAGWLAENAPEFGFIIRFPSGMQPVTGVAYEPWHLRYVGKVLAQNLTNSELTFDDFISQVAPGRIK